MTTPQPKEMLQNLELFVQQWSKVHYNGWYVIPNEAIAEVNKLICLIVRVVYQEFLVAVE